MKPNRPPPGQPKRLRASRWLLALALGGLVNPAVGETITLKPVADTSLFEFAPTNNLGAVTVLPVGTIQRGRRCRFLLRFAPEASLPTSATVTGVSLAVTVGNSGAVDSVFELRRVLRPWQEGSQGAAGHNGGPAADGEPTWLARAHPAVAWSEPGGKAGSDFSLTASSSVMLGAPETYSFASTPAMVADVQDWLAQPTANFGWLMLSRDEATSSTAKRLNSREADENVPTLTIDYTLPPPPPHIDRIELAGDEVRLLFPVLAGKLYAIEYKQVLPGTDWQTLGFAASKFFPTNWVTTDSRLNGAQRFYRVGIIGDID